MSTSSTSWGDMRERDSLTLAGSGADVGDEASPAGVWLGGALLTGVAPRSTNGGAAEGLGADDSTELTLAHLVVHLGETRPRPVVYGAKEMRSPSFDFWWIEYIQRIVASVPRTHLDPC